MPQISKSFRTGIVVLNLLLPGVVVPAFAQGHITTPEEQFGFPIGADYQLLTYTQVVEYWQKLDQESDRMELVPIGQTAEGRTQYMAIISAPENLARLEHFRRISQQLALAENLSDEEARRLAAEGRAVVWIDGGLHASEVSGSHQLVEMVYQMVSRNDPETHRFLRDVILLAVHANPDGQELVATWYMREKEPKKRSLDGLPRLYQKYIGHDNNRDSYMVTQPETENMSRIMYREWFPQIMYNHHQTGPNDIIVFVPPFRDPPNYFYDPLLIAQIEAVGAAMHSRLIAEGKPGSGMRSTSTYSIWFNGNLRTTGYFHNQIGLLTEIKGNPTPMKLAFFPDRLLPSVDFPFPHVPREWHFREAIDYEITLNRAVLDYASRNRETLLYNRYLMGKNNIEKGSRDHWTIHPDIVDEVVREAKKDPRWAKELAFTFRRRGNGIPYDYLKLFRKPENRDPRAYILPADQRDFPTATKFINTFIKNGITVHQATTDFTVAGRRYPAGSYVIFTAQAFRPYVLDMFEPQDHPNDFLYEGGPPIPPYDNAGYTLAFQMGIEFDRILEGFDGPFRRLSDPVAPFPGHFDATADASVFLLSPTYNDAAVVVNRLLSARQRVFRLMQSWQGLEAGTFVIPATPKSAEIAKTCAGELGVSFSAAGQTPPESSLKALQPVRIGLWDRYGGSMPSGWTRWLLEQFEFPFERVFPKTLDQGNLINKFDVLIFVTDAIPPGEINLAPRARSRRSRQPRPEDIPKQYRDWLGEITTEKTVPQLAEFLRRGGTILAIGSSTNLAPQVSVPISNHITDGEGKPLPPEEYYIPSSILQVRVDTRHPLAFGMKERTDIFFDNSPVFRLQPEWDKQGLAVVAWFDSDKPLRSGWAWGQHHLYGGAAVLAAKVGKGQLFLFGPEILFRGQSHGTFKFLFNGIYLAGMNRE